MKSTIYSVCPQCATNALVQHVGASYRCAACSYDYGALRTDQAAREAWMLAGLRAGPAEKLAVLFLHRLVMELPLAESNARVMAFAETHGVMSPKPKRTGLLAGIAVAIVLVVVTLALVAR